MADFVYTGGELLALAGGDISLEPVAFTYTAGALSLSGGAIEFGGTAVALSSLTGVRLDRLRKMMGGTAGGVSSGIGRAELPGQDGEQYRRIYNENAKQTEAAIDSIVVAINAIVEAQATAQAANDTANAVKAQDALKDSYTSPASVLTADSSGNVTIAAHDRIYTDGDDTTVSVTGDTLATGEASGVTVYPYYLDADRAGGAVTFQYSTSVVAQTGNTHCLSGVTVPASGDPPAGGGGSLPPGAPGPGEIP